MEYSISADVCLLLSLLHTNEWNHAPTMLIEIGDLDMFTAHTLAGTGPGGIHKGSRYMD